MTNTIKPSAGNPIKLFNSSLEGVTVTDDGDVQVKLGDAAGVKKLSIRDSGDVEVAYIDSDGIISGASGSLPVPVEGNVLIGDSTPEWALLDASADTKILVGNGTTLASVALSGDVTMTNAGAVTIADGAVTLAKLANVTRGSLIVGGVSDAPTLLSGKTLGAILIGDGTDIGSTVNPSIAGNVGIGGTLTVNTTDLVVNGTGVGIGTSSPTYLLHLQKSNTPRLLIEETLNTGRAVIQVQSASSTAYALMEVYGSAATGTSAGYPRASLVEFNLGNNGGALINQASGQPLMFATANTERMRISSTGNVGISETTIPIGAKLAVGGGISVTNGSGGGTLGGIDQYGQVLAKSFYTTSAAIADDALYEYTPTKALSGLLIVREAQALTGDDTVIVSYYLTSTHEEMVQVYQAGAAWEVNSATDITTLSTTTDGKWGISAYGDKIQIRNRRGGTRYISLTILGAN